MTSSEPNAGGSAADKETGSGGLAALCRKVASAVAGAKPGRGKTSSPRKTDSSKQGLWGERKAEEHLVKTAGLEVVGRRVKISRDEIDLVMKTTPPAEPEMVFVEVKTRSSKLFGGGRAAMDRRKKHALCRAVIRYMRRLPPMPFRIDLVEVYGAWDSPGEPEIVHYENAVRMDLRYDIR
ncbi:MAG: YraN family protein [Kiritimatiellae bacterium]|nr:YraN family protein [Kiritimatiellia bacterium]